MKHILDMRDKEHLAEIGIVNDLKHIHAEDEAYVKAKDHWKATLPNASDDELHVRALANIAWKQQNMPTAKVESLPAAINLRPLLRPLWVCAGLLCLLVILSVNAHCQFSHVSTISATDGTHTVFSASPFSISFTGCTVGGTGSAWTITCAGSAANPGGSAHQLQVNSAGTAFAGISNGTAGQVLCSNGTTNDPSMCDPVVSGPDAVGAASTKPPVQVAGNDGTNVRAIKTDTSGDVDVVFPSPQHVIVDTAPTTAVTGAFFQATQPVSVADGSQVTIGAKADAKSTATDTTAITIMQVLKEISAMAQAPASTPVTGTFWQATQPVSGTVTANAGTNLNTSLLALEAGGNLASIKTDVDKIPASPSTDRTTAAAPFSTELSDGAAFYTGTKTGQLPTALDGSGFLKTHEQGTAAISAASLPLPTGAAADSSLTTLDTDVKANVTLHAGTNLVGKVGIDQTTLGTTNAVTEVGTDSLPRGTSTNPIYVALNTPPIRFTGALRQPIVPAVQLAGPLGPIGTPGSPMYVQAPITDPCAGGNKRNVAISVTANAQLFNAPPTGTAKICAIFVMSTSAETFSLVGGTGTTCATATEAIVGSTTAANGPSAALSGGYSQGSGVGTIAGSNVPGNNVCILISGSTLIAGNLVWAY